MTSKILKIDFFGEGYGETIFLELPNGKVGIIDCGNKIFIEWFRTYIQGKNTKNIDFIVWTHPHADHTSSFPSLLELCQEYNISIDYFMRFGIRKFKTIAEVIEEQFSKEIIPDNIAKLAKQDEAIFAATYKPSCLKKTIDLIESLKQSGVIKNINNSLNYGQSLFSKGSLDPDIEIFCIAPTDKDIDTYYDKANQWTQKKLKSVDFSLNSSLHNIISVALCIKYGEASIILGGDVLNQTWNTIFNETRHQAYSHDPLKMIKVPHHGSNTAYLKDIWDKLGSDIYSVICPLVRYPLPKTEDIDNILEHTKNIFILKDKHIYTLLDYICQKTIGCQCKLITESPDATNHISFKITETGNISHQWL